MLLVHKSVAGGNGSDMHGRRQSNINPKSERDWQGGAELQ